MIWPIGSLQWSSTNRFELQRRYFVYGYRMVRMYNGITLTGMPADFLDFEK